MSGAGGFGLLRPAEPSERGPSLKICLNGGSPLFERHFTFFECGVESFRERLAFGESGEDGEFLRVDAAEVDGVVDAMNDEIYRLRIELGDGTDVLFLSLFGKGVAGEVGVVLFAHGE